MMKTIKSGLLAAALLAGGALSPAHAAIQAVDDVPAATLLLPYFEIDTGASGLSTVMTVGNASPAERLAHVTLWTDRGVPTYSFDVRLAGYGVSEIDLRALFVNGTLPQSTAGGFATCSATLPPAALAGAQLTGLRNAHSGAASTLLGGMCGGAAIGDGRARGYVTVDVSSACTTLVPGDVGYFVLGGTGIARNDNVLWGEYSTTNPVTGVVYGDTLVHVEASATDPFTDGAGDYTFYGRRLAGSGADNREGLPEQWRGSYSLEGVVSRTTALVWRDPGNASAFACASPPLGLTNSDIVAFDHQENPNGTGAAMSVPYAAQAVRLDQASQIALPYTKGFVHYELQLGAAVAPFGVKNQAHVSHVYESIFGSGGMTTTWPIDKLGAPTLTLGIGYADCSDGIDNDGDGDIDFPADDECGSARQASEAPQCSDGISNDADGLIDFPNDPGCANRFGATEAPECNDGVDNEPDTFTDFPNDPECTSASDTLETANPECSDGIDNDFDGQIDAGSDTDCNNPFDNTERGGLCSDGIDNDGDTLIDFPADPGCSSRFSNTEGPLCNDGIDNDTDGLTDFPNDPGCTSASASSEGGPCHDGIDNDGDLLIDFPNDPGCATATSNSEAPACSNGVDNDGDLLIDFPNDPGCASASSNAESPQCNDTVDNDLDTLTDFPNDPDCASASDNTEFRSQCSDGIDNDGNGVMDAPNDPGCSSAGDPFEGPDCSPSDLVDDDLDDLIDFGASPDNDPGCASPTDQNELSDALTRGCADGIDNDGDGMTDYPADPDCINAWDDVEFSPGGLAPTITVQPGMLPNGTGGTAYSQQFSATGGTGPYTFAVTAGALPAGLTLSTAGLLSGTPTQGGTFNFTITATDSNTFSGSAALTLTITTPTITVQPTTLPPANGGTAYSQQFTASGGTGPYTFAVTAGTLPTGLTLSPSGLLSGTPMQGGSFNFTITATDSNMFIGNVALSLNVIAPSITVLPAALPSGVVGASYNQTLSATGGTAPYTFAVTAGTLPQGLTLSPSGQITGTLGAAGTFSFTVTATDAGGFTGTRAYSVGVSPILVVPTLSAWMLALLLVLVSAGSWIGLRRP